MTAAPEPREDTPMTEHPREEFQLRHANGAVDDYHDLDGAKEDQASWFVPPTLWTRTVTGDDATEWTEVSA